MQVRPAVVVVTYNRPKSLERLLGSLLNAVYKDTYPDLVISIDYSHRDNREVCRIADTFAWPGEKRVIRYTENQGLKRHILSAGLLALEYSAVILLEDDLFVSPDYYSFAESIINLVQSSPEIAGVSLYSSSFNESSFMPFSPLLFGADGYLLQLPSSWGQLWTADQYQAFYSWLQTDFSEDMFALLPAGIKEWSEHSWKKLFCVYLIVRHKYFFYPYSSFSSNLNESGVNHALKDSLYINPLVLRGQNGYNLSFSSLPRYDASFCLEASFFEALRVIVSDVPYVVDWFGAKFDHLQEDEYLLTLLPSENPLRSFALEVLPVEMNVIMNLPGKEISLARKKDILTRRIPNHVLRFFYPIPSWYQPLFYPSFKKMIFQQVKYILHKIKGAFR